MSRWLLALDPRAARRSRAVALRRSRPSAGARGWCRWAAPSHLALVVAGAARARASRAFERLAGCSTRSGGSSLALLSVLFFLCALYAPGYLRCAPERSNRVFCACLLAFLGDDDPRRPRRITSA